MLPGLLWETGPRATHAITVGLQPVHSTGTPTATTPARLGQCDSPVGSRDRPLGAGEGRPRGREQDWLAPQHHPLRPGPRQLREPLHVSEDLGLSSCGASPLLATVTVLVPGAPAMQPPGTTGQTRQQPAPTPSLPGLRCGLDLGSGGTGKESRVSTACLPRGGEHRLPLLARPPGGRRWLRAAEWAPIRLWDPRPRAGVGSTLVLSQLLQPLS